MILARAVRGDPKRPVTPGAPGSAPLARSLLLAGVATLAMAATNKAIAQQAQLPPLVVEGGQKAPKKKSAAKKAPATAAVAPAPAATPATQAAKAVKPSDVPYTTPAAVSTVGQGEIQTFGQTDMDKRAA